MCITLHCCSYTQNILIISPVTKSINQSVSLYLYQLFKSRGIKARVNAKR